MRTYDEIVTDFIKFLGQDPEIAFSGELEEAREKKAQAYSALIDKCCEKKDGVFYFTKFIIGDLNFMIPEPYTYTSLIHEWQKLCSKYIRLCILCPRQHGKSLWYAVVKIIRDCFLFKNFQVLIESSSSEQAKDKLKLIKKIILNNEALYSKIGKNIQNSWTKEYIDYNGGYIMAKGFGSEIRGFTFNLVVIDDILRSDNKLSNKQIEKFLMEEIEPASRKRKGQIIVIGTPKDSEDIFHFLEIKAKKKETSWFFKRYQAIIDEEKRIILCPELYTYGDILQIRIDMDDDRKFMKEYQCDVSGGQVAIFPNKLLKIAELLGKDICFELNPRKDIVYYVSVDCARSGESAGDYTVITVLTIDEKNFKKIAYIKRIKGLKIQVQVEEIAYICKKYNNATAYVETNNMGQDFIDMLTDDFGINVISYTVTVTSKPNLIRLLINAFEREKIIIPRNGDETNYVTDELLRELRSFSEVETPAGNKTYKGMGTHDDMVMSLALGNKAIVDDPIGSILADYHKQSPMDEIYDKSGIPKKYRITED